MCKSLLLNKLHKIPCFTFKCLYFEAITEQFQKYKRTCWDFKPCLAIVNEPYKIILNPVTLDVLIAGCICKHGVLELLLRNLQ